MKGKGVASLEDINGWHGKALKPDQAKEALAELGGERNIIVEVNKPEEQAQPASTGQAQPLQLLTCQEGSKVATRWAYGDALKALGAARPDVVALDAEVSNSTYAEDFAKEYPDRYFEM